MSEALTNSAIVKNFTEFLEAGHYRKTPERFAILNKVLSFAKSFTIDQLENELEQESFHVSRATLYNNVELFIEAGILRKLYIDGLQVQYERWSSSCHAHLICTVCGKVKDVKDNNLAAYMNAKKYTAFNNAYYCLCVYGMCSTCARKLKKSKAKSNKLPKK